MKWWWLVPPVLLGLVLLTGCEEKQYEEMQYEDEQFLEWLSDSLSDTTDLIDQLSAALDTENYNEVEVLADMLHQKCLLYYQRTKSFEVSDKYREVQHHAAKYFYYSSVYSLYIKEYAHCMREGNYNLAEAFLEKALDYIDKCLNELEYIREEVTVYYTVIPWGSRMRFHKIPAN